MPVSKQPRSASVGSLRTRVWSVGRWAVLLIGLAITYGVFLLTSLQIAIKAREVKVPNVQGQSVEAATQAVCQIAEKARRIILFDRARDTACKNLAQIDVPQQLQAITTAIPVEDFQSDISSTQLRR